ncbi:MAG: Panacea domain-containing protein [Pseudonocardiaceae bacterium]
MTVSARDVAAALRDRLPGLPTKKLHKLLYYCQGHHLAAFDEPLFSETISAWDMGPVVGNLWYAEKQGGVPRVHREMDEAQLNTVGYVLSRCGALTGQDLENLTHSEEPWQLADNGRQPGESARIEPEWLKQYFRTRGSVDDEEDGMLLDSTSVTQWLQGAEKRREDPVRSDSREELVARLEELRARLPSRA